MTALNEQQMENILQLNSPEYHIHQAKMLVQLCAKKKKMKKKIMNR